MNGEPCTLWRCRQRRPGCSHRGRFDSAIECIFGGVGLTRTMVQVVSLFSNVVGKGF